MRKALEDMRRYFWCTAEPGWVDLLVEVENECWNETGIAPPGRSEPLEIGGRNSDEQRRENWVAWINAKRMAVLKTVDEALEASNEIR